MLKCWSIVKKPYFQPAVFKRCFAFGSPTSVSCSETIQDGEVIKYRNRITSGRHVQFCDLMPAANGNDEGPSPKEFILMGLASCTSMSVRMFADRKFRDRSKGWEEGYLSSVNVDVEETLSDLNAHVPSHLTVKIKLNGELSANQKSLIMMAASRCPVKRMLCGEIIGGIRSILIES